MRASPVSVYHPSIRKGIYISSDHYSQLPAPCSPQLADTLSCDEEALLYSEGHLSFVKVVWYYGGLLSYSEG